MKARPTSALSSACYAAGCSGNGAQHRRRLAKTGGGPAKKRADRPAACRKGGIDRAGKGFAGLCRGVCVAAGAQARISGLSDQVARSQQESSVGTEPRHRAHFVSRFDGGIGTCAGTRIALGSPATVLPQHALRGCRQTAHRLGWRLKPTKRASAEERTADAVGRWCGCL